MRSLLNDATAPLETSKRRAFAAVAWKTEPGAPPLAKINLPRLFYAKQGSSPSSRVQRTLYRGFVTNFVTRSAGSLIFVSNFVTPSPGAFTCGVIGILAAQASS